MATISNVSASIDYDDLREWLIKADQLGEVRRLSGASWQKDMGLVAEAILRAENVDPAGEMPVDD